MQLICIGVGVAIDFRDNMEYVQCHIVCSNSAIRLYGNDIYKYIHLTIIGWVECICVQVNHEYGLHVMHYSVNSLGIVERIYGYKMMASFAAHQTVQLGKC